MEYAGNLYVVAAPSGAGKSSLVSALLQVDSHLVVAVSHTTRAPRGQEKQGREYEFTDDATFRSMIERGDCAWRTGAPLPFTKAEALLLQGWWPRVRVHEGEAALCALASGTSAALIHLACHGTIAGQADERRAVLLLDATKWAAVAPADFPTSDGVKTNSCASPASAVSCHRELGSTRWGSSVRCSTGGANYRRLPCPGPRPSDAAAHCAVPVASGRRETRLRCARARHVSALEVDWRHELA